MKSTVPVYALILDVLASAVSRKVAPAHEDLGYEEVLTLNEMPSQKLMQREVRAIPDVMESDRCVYDACAACSMREVLVTICGLPRLNQKLKIARKLRLAGMAPQGSLDWKGREDSSTSWLHYLVEEIPLKNALSFYSHKTIQSKQTNRGKLLVCKWFIQ